MALLWRICTVWAAILAVMTSADDYHIPLHSDARVVMAPNIAENKYTPPEEKDSSFWIQQAQNDLAHRLSQLYNMNKAKNIILFLGDGMSIATITAARILKGQRKGHTGEESKLSMESCPYAGLSKTYCTNGQTPDSACTATAYLCGVKTNVMTTGVNANVNYNNCTASTIEAYHVESIAMWAQRAGKATGIVTTTTVTHASPSAAYAHAANRMWECDADIVKYGANPADGCLDIATQLIRKAPGRNFNVILGGGMGKFLPKTKKDAFGVAGERLDGVNLINAWKVAHPTGAYVTTRDELLRLNTTHATHVFGTFNSGDLEFHLDAPRVRPTQPRLKEMAEAAVKLLQKKHAGYFLFIEGGRIDHGHHYTKAGYALDETLEFDEAIETVLNITNEEDTLVVVTADHAHTLSIAGYPGRGNPILGVNEYDEDLDGTRYATLNYAIGVERYLDKHGKRLSLEGKLNEYSNTPSYIKATMGTHAGEDVGIFARGPHAHLFSGVMQQNSIPHMMAYAACIGHGRKLCSRV